MIQLPKWLILDKYPAFFDIESSTAIEQTARLHGVVRELIEDYNSFIEKIEKSIDEFNDTADKNYELFTLGMRQEFQDFIDIVEMKLKKQDAEISDSITFIKENLESYLQDAVAQKLVNADLYIKMNYDPVEESIELVFVEYVE